MLFIIDLIIAAVLMFKLLKSKVTAVRGTNALTRTVRDVMSVQSYKVCAFGGLIATVVMLLLGLLFHKWYACIPTACVVVFSFVLQFKQSNSEQRVKDARVVTKGSLKVAGATAEAAGTVAGAVVAGPQGAAIGKSAGSVVGQLSDDFADSMTDVDAPKVRKVMIDDVDKFMNLSKNFGIPVEGREIQEIAADIIELAPDTLKDRYKELPVEQQAMKILDAQKEQI